MFTASLLAKSGNDFTVIGVVNDLFHYDSIKLDYRSWMAPKDEKEFGVKFNHENKTTISKNILFQNINIFVLKSYINGVSEKTTSTPTSTTEGPSTSG